MTHSTVLRRPIEDRMLAGVCSGLGRFFGIDPTLVRIGWVLLILLGGSGVLAYLLAWAIIPDEAGQRSIAPVILLLVLFFFPLLCALLGTPFFIISG